ncbi:surface protease GP63 [Trypanosoma cruzi]|uniref:Uncharacterized protein n=1 Tax=Trypanosoma cruzi Dm28c TaxID=1416333 RepID=V5BA60_TRYCR|nr:hypothetical protein TCDM_09319 [Trypanosoma cruzi Dm28c]RNF01837.1 surface protease GP63 [Trypanosoma cruzi]
MPSRARGIETPGRTRRRKRRITAYRRAKLASRSPDANSSWRQPVPNYRNERHALAPEKRSEPRGRRRRRSGKKPPPPGEARQTDPPRVKIRPKMAVLNGSVRRVVWWLGARHHARPGGRETAGYPPAVPGQFWETAFLSPHAFALLHPPLRRPFWHRRRVTRFRAFGATSRAKRVWGEGVSGVVVGLRGAHDHRHQAGGQAEPPLGGSALWTRARRERSTISPAVSWIFAGPYRRHSGRGP